MRLNFSICKMGTMLRSQWNKSTSRWRVATPQVTWLWVDWPYEDPQPVMPKASLTSKRHGERCSEGHSYRSVLTHAYLSSADFVHTQVGPCRKTARMSLPPGLKGGPSIAIDVLMSKEFAPLRKTTPPGNEDEARAPQPFFTLKFGESGRTS